MALFIKLAEILKEAGPEGIPIPLIFERRDRWSLLFADRNSDIRLPSHDTPRRF